jgi:hypothetical protein
MGPNERGTFASLRELLKTFGCADVVALVDENAFGRRGTHWVRTGRVGIIGRASKLIRPFAHCSYQGEDSTPFDAAPNRSATMSLVRVRCHRASFCPATSAVHPPTGALYWQEFKHDGFQMSVQPEGRELE